MSERDPNARTRETDKSRLERLGIHARENWYRDVWLFLVTIVLGLMAYSAVTTADQSAGAAKRARSAAMVSNATAAQARHLAVTIQRQRRVTLTAQCQAGNERHDATIHALDKALRFAAAHADSPVTRKQLADARTADSFLIDALAPRQNCALVVARGLGEAPPKRLQRHRH